MYAKSLVLASALAMATSVAANQPERPRIYFPREIKREFINSTITASESSSSTGEPTTATTTTTTITTSESSSSTGEPTTTTTTTITTSESSSSTGEPTTTTTTITTSESSSSTGEPTTTRHRSSSTTKRDLLSDLVSGIFGSDPIESKTASSTITSGSGLPKITLAPTTKDTESKQPPSSRTKNLSTDSVILIGPTGIVPSSKEPPTAKDPTSEASTARPTSVDAPPAVNNTAPATTSTTGVGILDPIGTLATLLLPGSSSTTVIQTTSTTAPVPSTGASATEGPSGATASTTTTGPLSTGTPSGLPPQLELPLPIGGSTTANSTTGPSAAKTPSGLLPTLPLPLSTGGSTRTNSRVGPATTKTPSGFLPSLTSSLTLLLPTGGSSTNISPVSLLPSNSTTVVPLTKTTSGSTTATGLPTSTTRVIPITDGTTTTGFVTTPTKVTDLPVTIPTTSQTRLSSTIVRVGNSTLTDSITTTKSTSTKPTVIPTTSTLTASQSTVQTPTTKPIVTSTSTASQSTVQTPTTKPIVTSIRPTGTVPNTDNWLPTTIVIEPTKFSFTAPTTTATRTTSQALPTTIPKIIYPDDPNKAAPEGTVPIIIGFKSPLNYLFVSSNTVAAAQIFKYLPRALSDASGVDVNKLQISKLVPYNTQDTWGYVTTIAQLNYPATLVDTLQMDIWSTNSAFYHNADPIVRNLTDLIEVQIDIHGNINDGSSNSMGGSNGGGNGNNNSNDAFGSGNGGNQSSKQKATTAGIAIAALGFSAMYGAAMFIIARRYKRKRQGHRRASSISSSPASSEMRYNGNGSPALMGGALYSRDISTYGAAGARDSHGSGGHSARTANISAPVATENSLGWN
ncbi:hypothetical protein EsDP_00004000 [Epichloe bromicola]|uniref:Msb2 n=1 Tax=Epichloe bromicola TaxID=79588 RepID=A0ABQ0CQE6_9HYPO